MHRNGASAGHWDRVAENLSRSQWHAKRSRTTLFAGIRRGRPILGKITDPRGLPVKTRNCDILVSLDVTERERAMMSPGGLINMAAYS